MPTNACASCDWPPLRVYALSPGVIGGRSPLDCACVQRAQRTGSLDSRGGRGKGVGHLRGIEND
eukprot:200132-Prorocentrum_minimum.AAC.1